MKTTLSGGLVHELPADFADALLETQTLSEVWEALTPIARNEFICWVEDARQEKTRVKRISRAIEELLDGQRRPCCWPGCIHRTDKTPGKWQQAGVKLFDTDETTLSRHLSQTKDKLALLPKSIRKKSKAVRDDF